MRASSSCKCPRSPGHERRRAGAAAAAFALALAAAAGAFGCGRKELPEQRSAAAQLYVRRCGNCHQPYDPRSMTAAMWETQVAMMRPVMARAGIAPLAPDELRTILGYLERNAGRH